MACVLSQSTLLGFQVALHVNCLKRALACVHFSGLSCSGSGSQVLHKGTDSAGPAFCALPRSEQLRQPGAWWAHSPKCVVRFITSLVLFACFPGCAAGVPSRECCVSPLGSWSLSATLLADVNHPGSQKDLVGNWERLLTIWWRMPSLGLRLPLAFRLWLARTCLSASGRGRGWSTAG